MQESIEQRINKNKQEYHANPKYFYYFYIISESLNLFLSQTDILS